jgi:parallel beta-helix repeat protein
MKRIALILLTLILILFLIARGLDVAVKASPKTWSVDDEGPADFHTIEAAISAASDGDIILVFSGTYNENVTIGKSLTLRGENAYTTIVNGSEAFTVAHITANNVALTNFTIRNGNIGVLIDSSYNNRISGNVITDNGDGLWVVFSSRNILSDNTITHNAVGIYIDSSNITTVNHNTITNNTYGVDMENCRSSIVSANIITLSNIKGIFAYRSDNGTIFRNTVQNNSLGIHLDTSNGNNIYQNNFIDNSNQTLVENSVSTWDNGYRGNYWSNYNGTDLNQDGIVDTPYIIDANNRDRYPLMNPLTAPQLATDINGDGKVDIIDISLVAKAYGSTPDHPRWDARCDIDNNKIINIIDISMIAKNFGKTV